jgi:Domain of unknown function (DUF4440)
MKLLIMLTLAVLTTAATLSSGQEKVTKTEELVREMDSKLSAALLHGDAASVEFADGLIADNYLGINAQGIVRHKSDIMAIIRAQASAPRSKSLGPEISLDESAFFLFGDTAILTGLTTTKYQFMEYQTLPQPDQPPAPNASDQERFTRVYSKVNGRWRLVVFQTTSIAKR